VPDVPENPLPLLRNMTLNSCSALKERVSEAGRVAVNELKDQGIKGGRKRRLGEGGGKDDRDRDDDVIEAGIPFKRKKTKGRR
jgi:ATP-dependent RNA helicase DDX47/RRP3